MINVYTKEKARSILSRDNELYNEIPKHVQDSIKDFMGKNVPPEEIVRIIVKDVKERGDLALTDWTSKLDKVGLDRFEVVDENLDKHLKSLPPKLIKALEIAYNRILAFHKSEPVTSWMNTNLGGYLGQIVTAIQKIGIYIPGGKTPLFSSVLMTAIPALVAGTEELIFTTPPNYKGEISSKILAACSLIQRNAVKIRIFKIGGAQAIAAMAYGTKQVPRVDKIVGPGNIFVNLAKKAVFGIVGVDGVYGPTETIIIADKSADPALVASDLLAQSEHDYLAIPILLTHDGNLIVSVQEEVNNQIDQLERKNIIRSSLINRGGIIKTKSLYESIQISNEFAPEHLSLIVKNPLDVVPFIKNAGTIFVGDDSFEVLGDYIAGPSHVIPTNGSARFSSPLSVSDFVKKINILSISKNKSRELSEFAKILAQNEDLMGHANAVNQRKKKSGGI